jgi:hypothetical protein
MPINWSSELGGKAKPKSSGIDWAGELGAPARKTPTISPQDQAVMRSFQSLPSANRESALNRLSQRAKAGDREAARKLTYLVPEREKNLPQEQDFTDRSIGGALYRTRQAIPGVAKDVGKTIAESYKTTGETIATLPHAANAAGIALASMYKGQKGEALAKSKQKALDEIRKTPAGKYFGKTVEETKAMPAGKQLAGIAGQSLENVLNVATLGVGSGGAAAAKSVASTAAKNIAAKRAVKSEGGYIRDLASGKFAKNAVHPEDVAVMDTFIDYARGTLKLSEAEAKRIAQDADRLAFHYKIGQGATSDKQLATAFQKALSGSEAAVKTLKNEAGFIAKPTGKGGLSGGTVRQGATIGAGYSVAEAGQRGETDPVQLGKDIATGTVLGGALGALPKVVGAARKVKVGPNTPTKLERGLGAVDTPQRPTHQTAIEAASNKGDMAEVARIINSMPDSDPYKRSMAELFKDRVPEGSLGRVAQDVGEDVLPTSGKFDPSSRVKQYQEGLQQTITNLEKDPAYLERLKQQGGGVVISNKETYRKAAELGPLDTDTIKNAKAGDTIDSVTLVRAKATLDSAAKDFTDFWKSKDWEPEALQQRIQELSDLEAGYHVMSAEPGRATQIQASFIDEAYKRAQKLKGLLEGTKGPNAEKIIEKELGEFDKAMAKATGTFEPGTLQKLRSWIEEYATATKLTSGLTHAINLTSNALTQPIRLAENIVSIGIGAAQGKTSLGQITKAFGTLQGVKNATSQLIRDLKQAVDVNAPDLPRDGSRIETANAIPGKLGKAIRTPFNFLQASDNFMKALLRSSELNQRAYEKAWQEGFRGKDLRNRIAELLNDTPADMMERANQVAKEFTFTSDPGPITQKIIGLVNAMPLGRLLVPFVSTPTNIAAFQLQRSPAGLLSPRNLSALRKGSNLERRDAIARLTVGTGLSVAGLMAAFGVKDGITGPAPSNPGEKDQFFSSGKKPYAIKVGNKWVQFNRFQPIGLYLTQAVAIRDKMMDIERRSIKKGVEVDELGSLFLAFANATAKGMTDLPFVQGVNGVVEVLSDPSELNMNRLAGGVLSGLFPNIGRDIASAGDELARKPETVGDQVKQMIPGARNTVRPRIDVFGEPQKQSGGPVERGFVKITGTDRTTKLSQALTDAQFFPSPPKEQQRNITLTKDEYQEFQVESGHKFRSKLERAIADASYQNLPRDRKQKTLEAALSDARSEALDEILGKQTHKPSTRVKRY